MIPRLKFSYKILNCSYIYNAINKKRLPQKKIVKIKYFKHKMNTKVYLYIAKFLKNLKLCND